MAVSFSFILFMIESNTPYHQITLNFIFQIILQNSIENLVRRFCGGHFNFNSRLFIKLAVISVGQHSTYFFLYLDQFQSSFFTQWTTRHFPIDWWESEYSVRYYNRCQNLTVSLSSLRAIAPHIGMIVLSSVMYLFILSRRRFSISEWFCL